MDYAWQEKLNLQDGIGVVLGSFSPLHKGHLSLIYKAKKENKGGCIVIVCGSEGDKGYPKMPVKLRYQLVRKFFQDDPLVSVYCLIDDEMGIAGYNDQWDVWLSHFENDVLKTNQGENFDLDKTKIKFYNGEQIYSDEIEKRGYKVWTVDRNELPICATMIRKNPIKYWDYIADSFKPVFSHNILIIGTASEGKTNLVHDIAKYFSIPNTVEWARGYMSENCIFYPEITCTDFLAFLNGQFQMTKKAIESPQNKGVVICDTDALTTQMYASRYCDQENFALTKREYEEIIEPVAREFTKASNWSKIFILTPKNNFTDDHTRYMNHSDIASRNAFLKNLNKFIKGTWLEGKVQYLDGGDFLGNFEIVKKYVNEVLYEQSC